MNPYCFAPLEKELMEKVWQRHTAVYKWLLLLAYKTVIFIWRFLITYTTKLKSPIQQNWRVYPFILSFFEMAVQLPYTVPLNQQFYKKWCFSQNLWDTLPFHYSNKKTVIPSRRKILGFITKWTLALPTISSECILQLT